MEDSDKKEKDKKKSGLRSTLWMIFVGALALWGLVQIVSVIIARHEILGFFSEALAHQRESLSSDLTVFIGLVLALPACAVIRHEWRAQRDWVAKPAVIVMTAGVALVASVVLYRTVPPNILPEPEGTAPAHASPGHHRHGSGVSPRRNGQPSHSASGGSESPPPAGGEAEAGASSAPKRFCGCSAGGAHAGGSEGSWAQEPEEPEKEWESEEEWEEEPEEEWEEPEEEWEEEPSESLPPAARRAVERSEEAEAWAESGGY